MRSDTFAGNSSVQDTIQHNPAAVFPLPFPIPFSLVGLHRGNKSESCKITSTDLQADVSSGLLCSPALVYLPLAKGMCPRSWVELSPCRCQVRWWNVHRALLLSELLEAHTHVVTTPSISFTCSAMEFAAQTSLFHLLDSLRFDTSLRYSKSSITFLKINYYYYLILTQEYFSIDF